jgi:peptidoglycan/LPS O-acetylase OafA/YrhL
MTQESQVYNYARLKLQFLRRASAQGAFPQSSDVFAREGGSPNPTEPKPLLRSNMPELDTVRGVAILMVIFFHGFASQYGTGWFAGGLPKFVIRLAAPGGAGVNLFFALSGFLITGILLDTKHRANYYQRFYLHRALRILPAYYAVLLLILLIGPLSLNHHENVSWKFLGLSAIYLANMAALFGAPMQFGVLWSLAVEEHFYIIWPGIIRNFDRRTIGVLAVLIAVGTTIARMFTFWTGHYDFDHSHYTWLVADALALGALLAVLVRGPLGTRKGLVQIIFASLGLSALLALDKPLGQHWAGGTLHITALNLVCTAAVSAALLCGSSAWSRLIEIPVLKFFGEISYGLYLIHTLILNIFDNLHRLFYPQIPAYYLNFSVMLVRFGVCSVIAIFIATLSRWYLEEPFLRLKGRLMVSHVAGIKSDSQAERSNVIDRPESVQIKTLA